MTEARLITLLSEKDICRSGLIIVPDTTTANTQEK